MSPPVILPVSRGARTVTGPVCRQGNRGPEWLRSQPGKCRAWTPAQARSTAARCAPGASNQEARTGTERASHLGSPASGLPPAIVPRRTRSHQREASRPVHTPGGGPQPGQPLPAAHRLPQLSAPVLPQVLPPGILTFPRSASPCAFPSTSKEEDRLSLKPPRKTCVLSVFPDPLQSPRRLPV